MVEDSFHDFEYSIIYCGKSTENIIMNIDGDKEKQIKQSSSACEEEKNVLEDRKKPPSSNEGLEDIAASPASADGTRKKQTSPNPSPVKKQRAVWKKPKDMPKRPLSAYNLFFRTYSNVKLGWESLRRF